MAKLLITPNGKQTLNSELDDLKFVERPTIIKAISEARAHGDLSENAEYHSAKEKQGIIEAQIGELEGVLAHSEIFVAKQADADGKVLFGCSLEVLNSKGKNMKFQLVSQHEAKAADGKISVNSPLGKALLGKETGDVVKVTAPAGVIEYEILKVSYPA